MRPTRIVCDVDVDRPGRQVSVLRLHQSDNDHAYGYIPIPIAVIGSGNGPTALLSAGTHGDEYEGQLIVRRLLRELDGKHLQGRLILLAGLNYPAVHAGTRCSPIDDGNLNRAFPGGADGGPTSAIAHFVDSELLPRCDLVVDLHSGGKASAFLPCAFIYGTGGRGLLRRKLEACQAFAAPWTVVVHPGEDRSLSAAAERHDAVMVATELGGGAGIDTRALSIGYTGVLRLLYHSGILSADPPAPVCSTRFLKMNGADGAVSAPCEGIFEPSTHLGTHVQTGDIAGWVHRVDTPEHPPKELLFSSSGIVLCTRVPARVRRGDYLFHLGREVDAAALTHSRGNELA